MAGNYLGVLSVAHSPPQFIQSMFAGECDYQYIVRILAGCRQFYTTNTLFVFVLDWSEVNLNRFQN